MSKKLTTQQFIDRAVAIHGDRFDYSKSIYKDYCSKVEIICKIHGSFWQKPDNHMRGHHGCKECFSNEIHNRCAHTLNDFLKLAKSVHGNRYDYSKTIYNNSSSKIEIICKEHGAFWQSPNSHISNKCGCPKCGFVKVGNNNRSNINDFILQATTIHGNKYDYSFVNYEKATKKIKIICKEHGIFLQSPDKHLTGHGCSKCIGRDKTTEDFIKEANIIHNEKYNYSKVIYFKAISKVEIICKIHGSFWITPNKHISRKDGCPRCVGRNLTTKEFIEKSKKIHGDLFEYDKTNYRRIKEKIIITCKKHGDFLQTAEGHLTGRGCLHCRQENQTSKSEQQIADWIESLGIPIIKNNRQLLNSRMEIDIYIPSLQIGIEYNGCYWHSDKIEGDKKSSERKYQHAKESNIRLITIWDYEWANQQDLVKRHLLNAFGMNAASRIHARDCNLITLSSQQANTFYSDTHLQGACRGSIINLGLSHEGTLVAAMSFTQGGTRRGKVTEGEWELARYATSALVRGGASKLFKRFVTDTDANKVWSFSDRQHFSGGLYETLAFTKDGDLAADYKVIDPRTFKVWHKSLWQRRHIPKRLQELDIREPFDPETDVRTEWHMQDLAGVLRIWDAGKTRWVWEN